MSRFKRSVATGGFFIPVLKSRATGTGSTYDVSKQDSEWDHEDAVGATGGCSQDKSSLKASQVKPPPEQMKVFRIGDDLESEQNSPKGRKMFYTSSEGPTKSGFPGSLFPLEASPRHQRKALNISEPFSVSVPLRVSAVISANSTPCRGGSKERHLLSSLEELPLLEPDASAKSAATELSGKAGLKAGAGAEASEPVKMPETRRPCLKDLSPDFFEEDDRTLTLKEILLEMSQLPDLLPLSAVDRKPVELTVASVNALRDLGPNRSQKDTMKTPEATVMNDLDNLLPRNQEDNDSITLPDPLWSDIQDELKIIESEEDLTVHSESVSNPKRAPTPPTPSSLKPEGSSDGLPGLYTQKDVLDSLQVTNGGIKEEKRNQNPDLIPPIMTQLENVNTLPQETQHYTKCDQTFNDGQDSSTIPQTPTEDVSVEFIKLVPLKIDIKVSYPKEEETRTESEDSLQVGADLEREEDLESKPDDSKSSESLENEDEIGAESSPTFELEELEDHHWVTSPLHSPKLKNIPEKDVPAIPPKRRGTTGQLYKRPEFKRSLSLDSKDSRTSQWTVKLAGIKAEGGCYIRWRTDHLFNQNLQSDARKVISNLPEVPVLRNETETVERAAPVDPVVKLSCVKDSEFPNPSVISSTGPLNVLDKLPNVPETNTSTSVCPQVQLHENRIDDNKDESEKTKYQPSPLDLHSTPTSGDIFTFDNVVTPSSVDVRGQQVHHSTTATTISLYNRSNSLNQKPVSSLPNQSTDLDHTLTNHAPTGRRNSAPVSVSAVRASFMIKMCQAKAVPVIPPKVQYTEIPQPLQTVNTDSEVPPLEDKAVVSEPDSSPNPTPASVAGHNNIPQSPKTPVGAVEEKENNDPVSIDTSNHSSLKPSTDNSQGVPQEAPILRRKRTSDGEASSDMPLSSKMERPSGLSKSSFRSRPGRPQSLILFSPPFPIMDHPSVDSRMFLTPIKSPTQTTSQESAGENHRTAEGVILRNKMTIPKNGQRLETSTSCFYQPQRRSVILDSRSGRQIE